MSFNHNPKLWQKFARLGLTGFMLAAPLGTLQIKDRWEAAQAARREASGLTPARYLMTLLQVLQQHRGLSVARPGGNDKLGEQRAAKQKDVDAALTQVLRATARHDTPGINTPRDTLTEGWATLPARVADKKTGKRTS